MSEVPPNVSPKGETPPPNQTAVELVERFLAAYNSIDRYLQQALNQDSRNSFRSLVDLYARRHHWWEDAEQLRVMAGLRNILVHEKLEPYTYICIPTADSVACLEAIRDRLIAPPRVMPDFARSVTTLTTSDPLSRALRLIQKTNYSRFPVYRDRRFMGLLTENTITRWLAERFAAGAPCDLEVAIGEVLPRASRRQTFVFVAQNTRLDEVAFQFRENTFLEAVLITEHGYDNERLLGIITRGDVG